MRDNGLPEPQRRDFIGGDVAQYLDELMRDMGLCCRRERSPGAEFPGPLWAARYRGLAEERRRIRTHL